MTNDQDKKTGPIVDTVIFDIGDVLISDGLHNMIRTISIPETPQIGLCCRDYYLGRCTEEEFWRRALEGSVGQGREEGIAKQVREYYNESRPSDAVPFVSQLKSKGYNVAILSNHSSEWARSALRGLGLESICDPILISAEIHLRKPDPAVFAYTLKAVNRQDDPGLCAFFDDKPANIETARSFGIRAFQYTGRKSLEGGLQMTGVLGPQGNIVPWIRSNQV